MTISEFYDGCRVYGQFLVKDATLGTTSGNKRYLNITLQDATGTIDSRKWDPLPEDNEVFVKGNIVLVEGDINLYRDALQMKIIHGEAVALEGIDWSKFIPTAPVKKEIMKEKLDAYIASISDEDVAMLVKAVVKKFEKRLYDWPAAVRNHHDYVSGLLYHSITMADMTLKVAEIYPALNRDLLLGGVIIHDLGKTVELSGPNATEFTLEGKLLGHISIGQAEVRMTAKEIGMYAYDELQGNEDPALIEKLRKRKEVAILLEHIVISHHGHQEFGSPVLPLTREALVVSIIDDLDAKLMILDKAYAGVEKGKSTAKIFSMDDRYFYRPSFDKDDVPPAGLDLEDVKKSL